MQGGSFLHTVPLPAVVYLELFSTFLIHILLYLILSFLQTLLMWGVLQWISIKTTDSIQLLIWSTTICALLTLNVYFFPLSVFSTMLVPGIPKAIIFILMAVSLGSLLLMGLAFLGKAIPKYPYTFAVLATVVIVFQFLSFPAVKDSKQTQQPNIIFIGIDSLSPSNVNPKTAPNIYNFINQSVQFKETISPLARTYPAWASILTGLYPEHHGARYNLIPQDLTHINNSLARILKNHGYYTIYATDDRRFNSMDKEFGFTKIIGPKTGVNDVLLGTFNDFPLSNLLINVRFSYWLFPYNYMNRASFFSYYPETFDAELRKELNGLQNRPVFFAVHFTLPHWPYAWASSQPSEVKNEYSVTEREQLYTDALIRTDRQVGDLISLLDNDNYLDNSFIIMLSDHGEVLYHPGSRQTSRLTYQDHWPSLLGDYFKRKTSTELDKSAGHGSDLLSSDQFHCLLGAKVYKNKHLVTQSRKITSRVSLIDIAPTVLAYLGLNTSTKSDGISLWPAMQSANNLLPERGFIMESGEFPNQFLSREKARLLGKEFFEVSPTGSLELRKDELKFLDEMKLYAYIEGNWIFALYPDDNGYIPVILQLSDNFWSDNFNDQFTQSSPAQSMLKKIESFYKRPWKLILKSS